MLRIVSREIMQRDDLSHHLRTLLLDLVNVMFKPDLFAETMQEHTGSRLLSILPKQGIKLYLMSNYNGEAFDHVRDKFNDMLRMFDDVMISGNEGIMKPQREIYELAMRRWNVGDPSTVLYIDDDALNVKAARNIGFNAIHYTTYEAALLSLRDIVKT